MTINDTANEGIYKGQILIPKLVTPQQYMDLDCPYEDEDVSCDRTER